MLSFSSRNSCAISGAHAATARAGEEGGGTGDADAEARGSEAEVGPGDLDEAEAELEGAAKEAEILAAVQDPAYYPRDPILGLLQSSLQRYWLDKTDPGRPGSGAL